MQLKFNQPDNLDLADLRDALEMPGTKLLFRRYQEMLDQLRGQLETAKDWTEHCEIVGAIRNTRTVLAMPRIIADQIRAASGSAKEKESEEGNAVGSKRRKAAHR